MSVARRQGTSRASMRGFSLVELLVGIAVGMFVVAAAALMTSGQLSDNRRLLLETQLQQDLRAAADIVARDLRRAGYWPAAYSGVPSPAGGPVAPNPYSSVTADPGNSSVIYSYRRALGAQSFGFRLTEGGVLQSCADSTANGCATPTSPRWQALTDRSTVIVNSFAISPTRAGDRARTANADTLLIPCNALCSDNTTSCWPRVGVREFVITITGQSASDDQVVRSLGLSVRVRNDPVQATSDVCPVS